MKPGNLVVTTCRPGLILNPTPFFRPSNERSGVINDGELAIVLGSLYDKERGCLWHLLLPNSGRYGWTCGFINEVC